MPKKGGPSRHKYLRSRICWIQTLCKNVVIDLW
nr:MAG TPA: hypothetical protein [Caudoviricetes sp.]